MRSRAHQIGTSTTDALHKGFVRIRYIAGREPCLLVSDADTSRPAAPGEAPDTSVYGGLEILAILWSLLEQLSDRVLIQYNLLHVRRPLVAGLFGARFPIPLHITNIFLHLHFFLLNTFFLLCYN